MNLVFLKQGDLRERSWIEYLLQEVIQSSAVEEPWPDPKPNTIYALSSNMLPLDTIPRDFLSKVERTPGVGLVHISDEWLGGHYDVYRSFHFVIRHAWKDALQRRGILTIPLGFPNAVSVPDVVIPASQRTNTWMFFGNIIASRVEMMRAFSGIPNGRLSNGARIDHSQFAGIMSDTVFVPAPMGNLVAETWRLYEALELGCIPVLERRLTLDYHQKLFGKHPIPTFARWKEAALFVNTLRKNPQDLDALQAEIAQWWSSRKHSLVAAASTFVTEGASGAFRSDLNELTFSSRSIELVKQYVDLARHQTLESSFLLVKKVLRRGSVKLPY